MDKNVRCIEIKFSEQDYNEIIKESLKETFE